MEVQSLHHRMGLGEAREAGSDVAQGNREAQTKFAEAQGGRKAEKKSFTKTQHRKKSNLQNCENLIS